MYRGWKPRKLNNGRALIIYPATIWLILKMPPVWAGAEFLYWAEMKARELKKQFLRLDCRTGAKKINAYYEEKGFLYVGECEEAFYKGTLRQKKL